jgi:hypothetical protein
MTPPMNRLASRLDTGSFCGPISVRALHASCCADVPTTPGVYVVERATIGLPKFLESGTGGWFKSKDPNYPLSTVVANWVEEDAVLYVGMTQGRGGLRRRIRDLVRFGFGKRVGHRGGRMLWQIQDAHDLSVRWRSCSEDENAREMEKSLLRAFREAYGRPPFANMQ